jgi:hypothetical protein
MAEARPNRVQRWPSGVLITSVHGVDKIVREGAHRAAHLMHISADTETCDGSGWGDGAGQVCALFSSRDEGCHFPKATSRTEARVRREQKRHDRLLNRGGSKWNGQDSARFDARVQVAIKHAFASEAVK